MWWEIKRLDFRYWILAKWSISSLAWGFTSWRTTASLMVRSSRRTTSIIKSRSCAGLHQKITCLLILWFIFVVCIYHLKEAWNREITGSHIIWCLRSQLWPIFHRNVMSMDIEFLFHSRSLNRNTSLIISLITYFQRTISY